jgi:MGT family glycosyltransferase
MGRFLFAAWPYDGCIYPHISIARALVNRGHEVAFYTGSGLEPLISAQGFRFFPLSEDLDQQVRELLTTGTGVSKKWRNPLRRPGLLRRFLCDTVPSQVTDLDAIHQSWRPDAIICEPALYGPFLILYEMRNVPVAILEYSFSMLPGPDVPPPLGLPSPRSRMTRLQSSAGELALKIWGRQIRSSASDLRMRYGLPRLNGRIVDLKARLPLILVPSSREFDFDRKDPLPNVHYVGACLWYPPSDETSRLTELKKTRPWVHVTEGTLWAQRPVVLQAAAEGLANLPLEVIIATGRQTRPELEAENLPSNITVKKWVSYPDLLPRADVIVSIAGGGTVLSALSHGVPLVLIPLIWDQPDNAQRVVEAGAGIRLSRRECTPRRIRSAVERVLADPSYRQNAQRLARSLQRHGGPDDAAKLIEGLMVGPAVQPPFPAQ